MELTVLFSSNRRTYLCDGKLVAQKTQHLKFDKNICVVKCPEKRLNCGRKKLYLNVHDKIIIYV